MSFTAISLSFMIGIYQEGRSVDPQNIDIFNLWKRVPEKRLSVFLATDIYILFKSFSCSTFMTVLNVSSCAN